jgi:ABC-2 type transport system permease protein
MGLMYGASIGDIPTQLPRLVGGALIQVPAVWTLDGLAVLAIGLLPRLAVAISWAGFVFVNVFGEILGPVLGLSYGLADQAVPFHHLPKVISGGVFTPIPLLVLACVTFALFAIGLAGLRRRDIVA